MNISSTAVNDARPGLTVSGLLSIVEERSAWRKRRAEEHSDDARHASSARALRRLASYIAANPDEPCVRGLLAVESPHAGVDLSRLGESSLRELGGYGFGAGADIDPPVFLVRLAYLLQDDLDRAGD